MNGYHFLDKKIQFHFYINSIRKKKRFGDKWLSQDQIEEFRVCKRVLWLYNNEKEKRRSQHTN